jgi:hypothetical protein
VHEAGRDVLEPDVVDLIESGCGMLAAFVTASGQPFATRGWGLTVVDDGEKARLLVGAVEMQHLGYPPGGEISTTVAVTGANILTLRSVQLKGPITAVERMNNVDDPRRLASYCNGYFNDVMVVDSIPRYLMERMVPTEFVACEFEIVEVYDQTPGPNAGAAVAARPS